MKRLFSVFIIISLILCLSACAKVRLENDTDVTLTFVYVDTNVNAVLEDSEAEKVIDILSGNAYDPALAGTPACGFSEEVSFKIGNRIFAVAQDQCNYIQDLSNQKFFKISQEEMDYLRSLFEKYDGHFPCV